MLRSGHIPYNIFTPMEEDLDAANMLFNGIIIRGGISKISRILIEYVSSDGSIGGIGIEVKHTENGYPIGVKEKRDIGNTNGLYHPFSR